MINEASNFGVPKGHPTRTIALPLVGQPIRSL